MERDFGTLFDKVYFEGADLGYREVPVSTQSFDELAKGLATSEPVVIRLFNQHTHGYDKRHLIITDVHSVGDVSVYSVQDAERRQPGLFEFVLTEGRFKFNKDKHPKELRYISFMVAVEPVKSELT
ncbi:MAG: hypothetical protein ACXWLH_03925 [Candidatus Saccharimonadales bacterium]